MAVAAGRCRRLMLFLPPRHGKSQFASHFFPTWYLGNFPDRRVILASYEAGFAASWGRKVRNSLRQAAERGIFNINLAADSQAAAEWGIEDHEGGMVTAGVGGAITGRGGDLIIIDDPVKNSEEAMSATLRDRAWDWYRSTLYTRLEPEAALIVIQTRWHEDDLSGRILSSVDEDADPWEVISLPAFAEDDDPLGRQPGEALWPRRYPVHALNVTRRQLGEHWFGSLYQQRPIPRDGGFFRRTWFEIVPAPPLQVHCRIRFWDKAATVDGGDWTVGVLMSRTSEGVFFVEDVVRLRGSSGTVEEAVLRTAEADGRLVRIGMEQEPGSSGKDVIDHYRRQLVNYTFRGYPASGSKQLRADPLATQAEGGRVRLVKGPWNDAFIEEFAVFDKGQHDDQVDAASGAFAILASDDCGPARCAFVNIRREFDWGDRPARPPLSPEQADALVERAYGPFLKPRNA